MRGGAFHLWVYITVKRNHRRFVSPRNRQRMLSERRNLKVARSAHAYVPGNTLKFYEWLDADRCPHPQGSAVWICGDGNLGILRPSDDSDNNDLIQISDLDHSGS